MLKQQNPCSNNEIHMPFEHVFWLKCINLIGYCDVTSVFSVETNMTDDKEIPHFWWVCKLFMLLVKRFSMESGKHVREMDTSLNPTFI